MDDSTKKEILKSIALTGAASRENARTVPVIADLETANNSILDRAGGLAKIKPYLIKSGKFKLVLSQPSQLQAMSNFEIRCCLCRKVIAYPAWHHDLKLAVNHLHYFVCFDATSAGKPTARCLIKGV